MKVALAQINFIIGDFDHNCGRMLACHAQAREAGADLVLFSELSITGYPPKDMLLKPGFIDENRRRLNSLARQMGDGPAALVGFVARSEAAVGRSVRNALALLRGGRVEAEFNKSLLPTYDVFDEHRYFEPAEAPALFELSCADRTVRIGVTICEDLWNDGRIFARRLYQRNPAEELIRLGAQIIVNASASPFTVGKQDIRQKLIANHAATHKVPVVYVNQVGGNDELLFDGASLVYDAAGALRARARAFEEDLLVVDPFSGGPARIEEYPAELESVWRGLVMGTRDYVDKCRFRDVVIGLSGGIDSALVAAIAAEALGPSRVHGVAMPSRYSTAHSLTDAESLATNLGLDYRIVPISRLHAAYEEQLAPHFRGREPDVAEENIQARVRGTVLMALSNKFDWLLLTTGNKSELAVGYCTLYGDMCGGLAVISDVPKTMVYRLSRWLNDTRGREIIPESTISKPPSAELRPGQLDQDTLPPYEVLDAILHQYVELERSVADIVAAGFDESIVREVAVTVDRNEYKRKQMATGLKVTSRAFGVGRRMPIAAKFG